MPPLATVCLLAMCALLQPVHACTFSLANACTTGQHDGALALDCSTDGKEPYTLSRAKVSEGLGCLARWAVREVRPAALALRTCHPVQWPRLRALSPSPLARPAGSMGCQGHARVRGAPWHHQRVQGHVHSAQLLHLHGLAWVHTSSIAAGPVRRWRGDVLQKLKDHGVARPAAVCGSAASPGSAQLCV